VSDIEKMRREAHPMQAKKDLARRIVADFHSAVAAQKAAEDWAKQFQKDEVPEAVEEISIGVAEVGGARDEQGRVVLRLDRLLVRCGLAESMTDAARKVKQGSVRVENLVHKEPRIALNGGLPGRLNLRVGKLLKVAIIHNGATSA
jgi:tyrosyl-tRNA synthetase